MGNFAKSQDCDIKLIRFLAHHNPVSTNKTKVQSNTNKTNMKAPTFSVIDLQFSY